MEILKGVGNLSKQVKPEKFLWHSKAYGKEHEHGVMRSLMVTNFEQALSCRVCTFACVTSYLLVRVCVWVCKIVALHCFCLFTQFSAFSLFLFSYLCGGLSQAAWILHQAGRMSVSLLHRKRLKNKTY